MSETPKQAPDPVPGTPEYDEVMLQVAQRHGARVEMSDQTTGQKTVFSFADPAAPAVPPDTGNAPEEAPQAAPQRPENIPEKFWDAEKGQLNVEALLASYSELEKRLGAGSKPAVANPGLPPAKPAEAPAAPPKVDVNAAIDEVLAAQAKLTAAETDEAKAAAQAELDAARAKVAAAVEPRNVPKVDATLNDAIGKAAAEYAEHGDFSEETYAELERQGITREYATAYLDGLKARAEVIEMKVWSEAGGKDEFAKMQQWLAAEGDEAQIKAFNAAVTSGDLDTTIGAIRSLKARYEAALGTKPPSRVDPAPADTGPAVVGFKNATELTAAMRDPRYQTDPQYRAEVEQKLAASVKANVNLGVTAMIG